VNESEALVFQCILTAYSHHKRTLSGNRGSA